MSVLPQNPHTEISFNWIKSLNADIIFCFGWSNLLKKNILNLTPMGVLGFHPTKLPQNRGRHPLIWALALGLKKSASTFFFMDEGADSGDILSQKDFDISHNDDAKTLYDKVVEIALEQIAQFFPSLKKNNYKTIVQNNENNNPPILWVIGALSYQTVPYSLFPKCPPPTPRPAGQGHRVETSPCKSCRPFGQLKKQYKTC